MAQTDAGTQRIQVVRMFRRPRKPGAAVFVRPDEWLVLGHFDTLTIEQLSSDDPPLKTIRENVGGKKTAGEAAGANAKETDTAYCHPTYLVSEGVDLFPRFLQEDRPFMFFTRIHSSEMENVGIDSLQKKLRAIFEKNPDIPYFYAQTLELSDLVLLSKSNSIVRLLSVLEELSNSPEVGDIYSYCCISQAGLTRAPGAGYMDSSDHIGLVSMRFAVRDNLTSARVQVEKWVGGWAHKCFFVTGTEDVNLILHNISSSDLVLLLKDMVMDGGKLWEHFDDMTTRLGILIRDLSVDAPKHQDDPQPRILCAYQRLYDQLINHQTELVSVNWFRPLLQMLNTLKTVAENCILNQLCYVLLDGLQGLMEKLKERKPVSPLSDIQDFVSGMVYLSEHMIRMESQLIHHPETRPLLFHIPASIMELDLAFADLCAEYLQTADQEKRRFYFSIVPALQSAVNIKNLAYQEGDQAYLLYVGIPLDFCYDPGFIARVLVHEIAHFSGESARFRTVRNAGMVNCCAYMLGQLLGLRPTKDDTLRLARELQSAIAAEEQSGEQSLLIMENLLPVLQKVCRSVFFNQELIHRVLSAAVQDDRGSGIPKLQRLEGYIQHYKGLLGVGDIQAVTDALMELETLYRECYADIAMLQLLDMDARVYFELIRRSYENLDQFRPKGALKQKNWEGTKRFRKAVVVQRAGLVIAASFSEDTGCAQLNEDSEDSLEEKIARYLREFRCSGERDIRTVDSGMRDASGASCFLDFKVADEIYRYLCQCRSRMLEISREHREEKSRIKAIYDTFAVQEQYMSPTQVESISAFRKKLLDR